MRQISRIMAVFLFAVSAGCTNTQLRYTTVNQASTLADTQYDMVLRNLALVADNPGALPWHVNITGGTAQVTDAGSAHFGLLWNIPGIFADRLFQVSPSVGASRTIVQQWSSNPVVFTDALRVLQMAYRRAHGSPEMPDAKLLDDLAHDVKKQIMSTEDLRTETAMFFQSQYSAEGKWYDGVRRKSTTAVGDQMMMVEPGAAAPFVNSRSPLAREVAHEVNDMVEDLASIRPGWFGLGCRRDVPRSARYVAHEGSVYVWVCPEHVTDLAEFTLAILDLATAVNEPQSLSVSGAGVNFSPGFTGPP